VLNDGIVALTKKKDERIKFFINSNGLLKANELLKLIT